MKRHSLVIFGVAAAVVAVALIYGVVGRERALSALARVSQEQATLPVEIVMPQPGPSMLSLVLPGTLRAWYEAPIFAQVSGYVQSWSADFGTRVKGGQLLATIAAPSLDAQYAAAKANLQVAEDNYRLAAVTAKRWQALAGTPAVSQQEVDVQVAGAAARKAELDVAAQQVARYAALEAFKRVVAPFDGVVTSRLTDVGSYVNAAGGDVSVRGSSTELFTVADVHAMRVFVAVPQDYAEELRAGLTASLHLPSQPGKIIEAKFLTTAEAFSPDTRTSVTELTVDNSKHTLWPGTFVEVEFRVPSDPKVLTIPEEALIFRARGVQVAIVDAQNRVHLQNVTLGENLGQIVQVTSGLSAGEKLVNNPPAGLLEGQTVQPATPMPGYAMARQNPESLPKPPPPPPGAASGDGHTTTP
jgi:membrane fusion protein, multidrug efflux system